MHITLTRQEAEQLLSEIELNYQQKAVPLIEEAKKLECEVKERACKEWDELMGILKTDKYRQFDSQAHLMYMPYSPYDYQPCWEDFYRSNAYYRLKNALSSRLGFEIKVEDGDMKYLAEDLCRDFSLSNFGNVGFLKNRIELIERLRKNALDVFRYGTGRDFYQPEKPKSFFERLLGG